MQEDEVIADSEDEGSFPPRPNSHSSIAEDSFRMESGRGSLNGQPKPTDASGISDFSSIPRRDPALPGPSSISSFPSKVGQSSGSADPPARPRPKPIKRPIPAADAGGAAASSSIIDASAGPSMFGSTALLGGGSAIGDYPLTLAERAKTRVRNTKAAISPPVTSLSPGKSGTTSSGKLKKTKSAALPLDDDVIDISTDEETAKRKQKPKTKQHPLEPPKDRAAAAKAKAPAPAPAPAPAREPLFFPSGSQMPEREPLFFPSDSQMTMTSIPVFTSSILPPSDPPPPSSIHSTHSIPSVHGMHGIHSATPPAIPELVDDRDASPPILARKRKRPGARAPSPDWDGDRSIGDHSRMMPPPPPPFFASSSSSISITIPARRPKPAESSAPDPSDAGAVVVVRPPRKREREKEKKTDAAKKNKRRSSAAHIGAEPAGDGEGEGEGEGERADSAAQPKKRARSKQTNTVEVVINTSEKGPAAKKAFKSREIIADSDDDADPLTLGPSTSTWADPPPPPAPPAPPPPPVEPVRSESPLSSLHESEPEAPAPRKGTAAGRAGAKDKGKGKEKQPAKTAKRRVVDSDDEFGQVGEVAAVAKRAPSKKKKKANALVQEDGDQSAAAGPSSSASSRAKDVPTEPAEELDAPANHGAEQVAVKENIRPPTDMSYLTKAATSTPSSASTPHASRAYSIPRKSTPMSELIRRVNSHSASPLSTPRSRPAAAYSPLLKSSRSLLARIAPLHPTRKPPPPPPPPIPKAKERKTKKMLELEEKWDDELSESVDGWACMEEGEREVLRRRKKDVEMGWCED